MTQAPIAWIIAEPLRWTLTVAYVGTLCLIAVYGLHRYWLVLLFRRHWHQKSRPRQRFSQLPPVTVQIPMFNEAAVAHRIIDAACRMDYPAKLLQIQVLDDSIDDCARIARQRCEYWRRCGVNVEYRHRATRTGFKAGALAAGMKSATGQFIAIFDADFVPPRWFLRRTIHYFTDPQIGMVQTRWAHLNRNESLLTRGQAIFLDGHFLIEHTARNRSGTWINFNGTAGLWRRQTISAAGGWQHDTLTEDVDLSYRAQLAGWKFLFLPQVRCPAELPPEINSFKSQQHRWTKGSIQTAIKLLPKVLVAPVSPRVKLEALFHLTSPMVYLYITLLALMFYPAIFVNLDMIGHDAWLGVGLGLSLFMLGTISASVFYITSQRAQRRGLVVTILQVPLLMAIGIGIAMNNAVACIEALLGHKSPFIRTPKYGEGSANVKRVIPIPSMKLSMCMLEIAMGFYMLECIRLAIVIENTVVSLPFLVLFAVGYFYIGGTSLWIHARSWWISRRQQLIQAQPA